MGHCDRAAGFDLLEENRHDAAATGQHIPKAHRHESRVPGRSGVVERLDVQLRSSFAAPITLVGLTALSVLTMTNAVAPTANAASATILVPKTLFLIASPGLSSIIGTCLWAAQWKMTCG